MFKPEEALRITENILKAYLLEDSEIVKEAIPKLLRCCSGSEFKSYIDAFSLAPTQVSFEDRVYQPSNALSFIARVDGSLKNLESALRCGNYQDGNFLVSITQLQAFFQNAPRISADIDRSFIGNID